MLKKLKLRPPLYKVIEEMGEEAAHIAVKLQGQSDTHILHDPTIPEDIRYRALAIQNNLPFQIPEEEKPGEAPESLRAALARQGVYLFRVNQNNKAFVLLAQTSDPQLRKDVERLLSEHGYIPQYAITTPTYLHQLVDKFRMQEELARKSQEKQHRTAAKGPDRNDEASGPIVSFVNSLIQRATNIGASDIHIEPTSSGNISIRLRVDGKLRKEESEVPAHLTQEIITRIKIMAGLSIEERRIPQDGRISFNGTNIRVSTGPAHIGDKTLEQVVMRILPKEDSIPDLNDLGFQPHNLTKFKKLLQMANGIILITGPTGSGKSTTLAAAIHSIASPEVKVLSIEDPVEYRIPGVIQAQVNEEAGYTFANALRAFLRQDPDIIYVGEIRDTDTANIAVQAALTGHLVFGTLHTNDAPSAVTRLLQMGVKPYNLAAALRGVLAQRLVRKVCLRCGQPLPDDEANLVTYTLQNELGDLPANINPQKGSGYLSNHQPCPNCGGTGYKGRTAIHELFITTPEIANLIAHEAPTDDIRNMATANGMEALRKDGLRKVASGITTYEEVIQATIE